MKRTKGIKKPSAILTGDWHLRESTPICRMDDFWNAQWKKVTFIRNLQIDFGCPILHSGDLFDHWKPSPYLLTITMENLPDGMNIVYGNHDLPQNSLQRADHSGLYALAVADKLQILRQFHWSDEIGSDGSLFFPGCDKRVAIWHGMTFPDGTSPWPGCTDKSAGEILKDHPEYDLIVTGHNHETFIHEFEGRLLVNPGSVMRQDADQVEHEPCVFLWFAETNTVKKIIIPHAKGVISRDHIDQPEIRKKRLEAYINTMKSALGEDQEWLDSLSFEKNLEKFFSANPISKKIKELIWQNME